MAGHGVNIRWICQDLDSNATEVKMGWTSSPNQRGTINILWSCLFTVFLCTWTVLSLNIPAKHDGFWTQLGRKARWSLVAVFGPEILVSFAMGQWCAARRSVAAFRKLELSPAGPEWTMAHAFYGDMGGIVLDIPGCNPFPANSTQLHWLVEQKHLAMPIISIEEINDKSKSDIFAKIITIMQTSWFILQCIGRAAAGLAFTTLELSTVAFVCCTLPTYYFWLRKPVNVLTPTVIKVESTIGAIRAIKDGVALDPSALTPVDDIVGANRPSWSLTVMPKLGFHPGPKERPLPRLPNDRLPHIKRFKQFMLFSITLVYSSIHMIGWNFEFASDTEKYLWRTSALIHLLATFLFWATERHMSWLNRGRYKAYAWDIQNAIPQRIREALGITLPEQRPKVEVPYEGYRPSMYAAVLLIILIASYAVARLYLLVEVFLGLRSLPQSAYATVQWSSILPHV